MQTLTMPVDLVGSYRRFGHDGPVYHVVEKTGPEQVEIVVVETDETLNYSIAKAMQDPVAD